MTTEKRSPAPEREQLCANHICSQIWRDPAGNFMYLISPAMRRVAFILAIPIFSVYLLQLIFLAAHAPQNFPAVFSRAWDGLLLSGWMLVPQTRLLSETAVKVGGWIFLVVFLYGLWMLWNFYQSCPSCVTHPVALIWHSCVIVACLSYLAWFFRRFFQLGHAENRAL
jgi:hypothetical protein